MKRNVGVTIRDGEITIDDARLEAQIHLLADRLGVEPAEALAYALRRAIENDRTQA